MAKVALAANLITPERTDSPRTVRAPADPQRVRKLVEGYFDFIWRTVRRLGVPESAADDATQKVFLIASQKMGLIPAETERSFLFGIALRVAAAERRSLRRRPDAHAIEDPSAADVPDGLPPPDELVERHRARAALDSVLQEIPVDLGVVFILAELEEMTTPSIAELLRLPVGTVASRLRRSRELFDAAVNRLQARLRRRGAR